MSAYVNRLLQRFSPPTSGDGGEALQPFIRSRSPIAAIDQRLGVDESLGHGLGGVGGGFEPEESLADPRPSEGPQTRVQRKLAAAPASVPAATLAATPAATPALTPAARPVFTPAATPSPRDGDQAPVRQPAPTTELGPRREPMDPGPLFAPFALHHANRSDHLDGTSGLVEPRVLERFTPRPDGLARPDTSPVPAEVPAPPVAAPRVEFVPWVAFDRGHPGEPSIPSVPSLEPFRLDPRPALDSRVDVKAVPVLIEPREPARAPFIPATEPPRAKQETAAPAPARSEREPAAPKPAPSPRPQPVASPARGKLDIESISQIGPLARHFPNRRRFRLRFR